MPEKVQVEIDALRKAGDMSRIVYSNDFSIRMPERKITESKYRSFYRQEFLETGAFTPLFSLIGGCTLLIPKFYFDVYGGFDETFRAVQDYKKWFEIFRGKRLVYVRQPLVLSRQHAEQTTYKYSIRMSEEIWLYSWMIYNSNKDDIVGSGLTDMYHFYSAIFTQWWVNNYMHQKLAIQFAIQKIMELPESPDAEDRAKILNDAINNSNFKTYLPKEQEAFLRQDFFLRDVALGNNVNFIPSNKFENINPAENVRMLNRELLIQMLIYTPIRKRIFEKFIRGN